jgi:hypothetical protein
VSSSNDDEIVLAGFRHVRVFHALEFVDIDLRTARNLASFDLEALRPERFFRRSYSWSGVGVEKPPQVLSGRDPLGHAHHRVHGPVLRSGDDRLYLVDLGRTFEQGETESLQLQQTFIDTEGTLKPFLGCTARPGCQHLQLQVIFPNHVQLQVKAETRHRGSRTPIEVSILSSTQERKTGGIRQVFTFETTNPTSGTNFRISWERL